MIAQSNVTHMLVGTDQAILGAGSKKEDLAVGQVGVFVNGSNSATETALAAGDKFQVVSRNADGVLNDTPIIDFDKVSKKGEQLTSPTVRQVTAVGYNGTSGSIDAQDNTNYVMHIFWQDGTKATGLTNPVKFGAYYSSSNATQLEIAAGLQANLNKNALRESKPLFKAGILTDGASVDATGVGTLSFVNKSKFVAASGIMAVYTVGGLVRIGTDTTSQAYLIAGINGNVLELAAPYIGASQDVAEANHKYVDAATAVNVGLEITALGTNDDFEPGIRQFTVTTFDVELQDGFGATPITKLVAAEKGVGIYGTVAYNEWFLKGNRGESWRLGNYPKQVNLIASPGLTYSQLTFKYVDDNAQTLDRNVSSFGNVLIATETGAAVHASLKTVLGI